MGISQSVINNGKLGRISLSHTKLTISKSGFPRELRKKYQESKSVFRNTCRARIYNFDAYTQNHLPTFIESIYKAKTCPLNFDFSKLGELEFSTVTKGLLVEFNFILNPFDMKPSFESIEEELKKNITSTLEKLGFLNCIHLNENQISQKYNFNFEGAEEAMTDSIRLLDECLAEAAIPWIAFVYVMQSFLHLFMDKGRLLDEELKTLIDNVDFESLEPIRKFGTRGLQISFRFQAFGWDPRHGANRSVHNRHIGCQNVC